MWIKARCTCGQTIKIKYTEEEIQCEKCKALYGEYYEPRE